MTTAAAKRIGAPRPAKVKVGPDRRPVAYGRTRVDTVCEDWVVQDRWWTDRPLRRRYFELVLEDGRNVVVFHDVIGHAWRTQRS